MTIETSSIRQATARDQHHLIELARDVFHGFGEYESILQAWSEVEGVETLVAEGQEQLDGFLMGAFMREGGLRKSRIYVMALCVRSEERRKGVARSLMTRFFDWGTRYAGPLGAEEFGLDVAEDNIPARTFFEIMGFSEAGDDRENGAKQYPQGQYAVYMHRPVNAVGN